MLLETSSLSSHISISTKFLQTKCKVKWLKYILVAFEEFKADFDDSRVLQLSLQGWSWHEIFTPSHI